ncbi:MAG: sugar kinase, partial [Candidatus Heimdallarchaeota archaeon]
KTWLEELIEKFNTKSQAKFYIEHMGSSFEDYEDAHKNYHDSLDKLKKNIPKEYKRQIIEKSFLPNFLFGPKDLVIVIGQDGLVINTAKYLDDQLIVAVNPDPKRFDGVLIPFDVDDIPAILRNL